MRKTTLFFWLLAQILPIITFAQPSSTYYTASTLDGKCGQELELALKAIVYTHTKKSYDNLWTAYETTDPGPTDSIPSGSTKTDLVYDMYAWMCQFPKYYSDKDHTQTSGINREHCVPNSWWGGESGNAIAYTDLHHLVPGDGAANNAKSNWALGEYKSGMTLSWPTETKTNSNGYTYVTADTQTHEEGKPCYANASHVWTVPDASQYGGSTEVFEPADQYKGDFARMYLYVVCAYEGELTWKTNYMFTSDDSKYTTILPWAKELLLKWHRQDPVSDKERDRNNAVYSIQSNRNPFIDYPDLVEYIWGNKSTTGLTLANLVSSYSDEYNSATGGESSGDNSDDDTEEETPTVNKTDPSIQFIAHVKLGSLFQGFFYTTTSDGTAAYSSSDTKVASVDSQSGIVTLLSAGSATITYTVPATETYNAFQIQYGIVVEE